MTSQHKIAMWSGPRNLSTALMYSFKARGDCAVWDEPLYGPFLLQTGLPHPMRDEVLESVPHDPAEIIATLTGPNPDGQRVFYQKHMTHHLVEGVDQSWLAQVTNVFLIRHPARVIASFCAKREWPTFEELGFAQQAEIFDAVCALGQQPIVIDSAAIREDPRGALSGLCQRLGIPFTDAMLSWPAGGIIEDGVWSKVWYGAVHASTGFAGPEGPLPEITGRYAEYVERAMPFYERMRAEI